MVLLYYIFVVLLIITFFGFVLSGFHKLRRALREVGGQQMMKIKGEARDMKTLDDKEVRGPEGGS